MNPGNAPDSLFLSFISPLNVQLLRKILSFLIFICLTVTAVSQKWIAGTVYDVSRLNPVAGVLVKSSSGQFIYTDTAGTYKIPVRETDSLYFVYQDKPTLPFPVNEIQDPYQFDLSLKVSVPSKYSSLKEVRVFSKSHRQDSLENRMEYADVFNYDNPTLTTSVGPDGAVGADINELINIFRFKRKKRLKTFKWILEFQEEERYINYRFNPKQIQRITGLEKPLLDSFVTWYRPSYEFASVVSEVEMNEYILAAFEQFKRITGMPAKPEDED